MDAPFVEISRNEALSLASGKDKGRAEIQSHRWLVVGIPGSGKTHFLCSLTNKDVIQVIDADEFGHLKGRGANLEFVYDIERISTRLSKIQSFVFACPPDCAQRLLTSLFTDVLFIDNHPKSCYANRLNRQAVNGEPAFPCDLQSVLNERNFAISLLRSKYAAFRIYTIRQRVVGETGRAELV